MGIGAHVGTIVGLICGILVGAGIVVLVAFRRRRRRVACAPAAAEGTLTTNGKRVPLAAPGHDEETAVDRAARDTHNAPVESGDVQVCVGECFQTATLGGCYARAPSPVRVCVYCCPLPHVSPACKPEPVIPIHIQQYSTT